jgi:hypothetical protein
MDATKTKDLIQTARHYAQSSSNYLVSAESWVSWTDKDEDARDPKTMLLDNLASAEKDAREALQYINQIRAQCA